MHAFEVYHLDGLIKSRGLCINQQNFATQPQIPYHYREYLALVDWSGRAIRTDKRGAIDDQLPPILVRLGIDAEHWCKAMQPKGAHQFSRAVGCRDKLRAYASKLKIGWIKGISLSAKLFPT
jgi:hypothetical protein